MAAFTSKAAGDWASSGTTTWTQAGVPGSGDTVTITHAITISGNTTVGSSPNTGGTAAIILENPGSIALTSGTLTVQGDIKQGVTVDGASTFTMSAGTTVTFNVPASQQYRWNFPLYQSKLVCNGSSGSHCTVSATLASGSSVVFLVGSASRDNGLMTATYTDFLDIGTSTAWGVQSYIDNVGGAGVLTITNCTFTRCNYHLVPGGTTRSQTGTWTFGNNIFTSSKTTNAGGISGTCAEFGFRSDDTSTMAITFNSFDGTISVVSWRVGVSLTDNVVFGSMAATAGTYASDTAFARNFFYVNATSAIQLRGPIKDCYAYNYFSSNPNTFLPPDGYAAMTVTGCIFEGIAGLGETFLVQKTTTGTPTFTARYNICVPSAGLDHGGACLFAAYPVVASCLTQSTIEHNTQCSCNESAFIDLGETQGSYAGALQSVRSNLIWSPTAGNTFVNAIIDRSPTPTTDALATTPGAGYNGFWNPHSANCTLSGSTVSCSGYDTVKCSTAGFPSSQLGTGDVSANPGFVDSTRGLATWGGTTAGGGVATAAAAAATLAANPTLIAQATTGLLAWVRAGYRPTNISFQAASYPGDTSTADAAGNSWPGSGPGIGAMAYQSTGAVAYTSGSSAFRPCSTPLSQFAISSKYD